MWGLGEGLLEKGGLGEGVLGEGVLLPLTPTSQEEPTRALGRMMEGEGEERGRKGWEQGKGEGEGKRVREKVQGEGRGRRLDRVFQKKWNVGVDLEDQWQ